jgi:hypothetical protein
MPSPAEDPEGELGDSVQPQDPRMLRGFFLAQTLGPDPWPRPQTSDELCSPRLPRAEESGPEASRPGTRPRQVASPRGEGGTAAVKNFEGAPCNGIDRRRRLDILPDPSLAYPNGRPKDSLTSSDRVASSTTRIDQTLPES